jgi:hypothetical protein
MTSLMVRSVAMSAVTRVFDALWRRVSDHGAILRDAPSALLRMR